MLISFDGIIEVILKFQYICTQEDRNELRTWLFNHHLIVTAPKYYDRNTIFVDLETLIRRLKAETRLEYPSLPESQGDDEILSLDGINQSIRYHLVKA